MKYHYTEIPELIPIEIYNAEIDKMVSALQKSNKTISIFQVGGISNPGISDVDLYVVFKNNEKFEVNPVEGLQKPGNYLFTHRLFGTSLEFATQLEQYTFFRKYNLLSGDHTDMLNYRLSTDDEEILKHQIAIEYLIKAYISIYLSTFFKQVKLRGLLLHAKAILYDIDFLNINDSKFKTIITDILEIRNNWFKTKTPFEKLDKLIDAYQLGLFDAITNAISTYGFYISPQANLFISKRVKLSAHKKLSVNRKGISIPSILTNSSSSIQKIEQKLNQFIIELPISTNQIPQVLQDRQLTINNAIKYNNSNLPGFLCTAYGMNIFEKN